MEKDDDVKGNGNSYTTEFRMLDVRIGRWWSIDPVVHHFQSPYCTFDNNPILIADPSGANGEDPPRGQMKAPHSYSVENNAYHVQSPDGKNLAFDAGQTFSFYFGTEDGFAYGYTLNNGERYLWSQTHGKYEAWGDVRGSYNSGQTDLHWPLFGVPWNSSESTWPLNERYLYNDPIRTNQTTYLSRRDKGKREHGGRDIYTDPNTDIFAITSGTVLDVTSNFAYGTGSIVIEHDYCLTGTTCMIVRYGEVDNSSVLVNRGDHVTAGQKIATTGYLHYPNGTHLKVVTGETIYMLHIEIYSGTLGADLNAAPLSQKNGKGKTQRRKDNIDPIIILQRAR